MIVRMFIKLNSEWFKTSFRFFFIRCRKIFLTLTKKNKNGFSKKTAEIDSRN